MSAAAICSSGLCSQQRRTTPKRAHLVAWRAASVRVGCVRVGCRQGGLPSGTQRQRRVHVAEEAHERRDDQCWQEFGLRDALDQSRDLLNGRRGRADGKCLRTGGSTSAGTAARSTDRRLRGCAHRRHPSGRRVEPIRWRTLTLRACRRLHLRLVLHRLAGLAQPRRRTLTHCACRRLRLRLVLYRLAGLAQPIGLVLGRGVGFGRHGEQLVHGGQAASEAYGHVCARQLEEMQPDELEGVRCQEAQEIAREGEGLRPTTRNMWRVHITRGSGAMLFEPGGDGPTAHKQWSVRRTARTRPCRT
jgi:hypothetical protein